MSYIKEKNKIERLDGYVSDLKKKIVIALSLIVCVAPLWAGSTPLVEVSKTLTEDLVAQNIVDGDLSSKWMTDEEAGAWVVIDLKKPTTVKTIKIHMDTRYSRNWDLLYSMDKKNWKPLPIIKKSKNGVTPNVKVKGDVEVRYLKIDVKKNATKRGFGICEIAINGKPFGNFSLAANKKKFQNEPMWNTKLSARKRAEDLYSKLTLEEKIHLTRGFSIFYIAGVGRLGIPELYLSDASVGLHLRSGVREEGVEKTVAFPSFLALASTWNPPLAFDYAKSIGEECRADGTAMLLGPGVNIYRDSQNGRNFEYLGEDPYLVSRLTTSFVKGVQLTGTVATMKHFLGNQMERVRRISDSIISERAIHEIYLPAFKAAVDADIGAVMTGYNLVNGEWCGESKYLINDLLRKELGFEGLVMSDWVAVWDLVKVYNQGVDLIMPGNDGRGGIALDEKEFFAKGEITKTQLKRMVVNILATGFKYGLYDRPVRDRSYLKNYPIHEKVALTTAQESLVLLKNNGILPIADDVKKILIVGRPAIVRMAGKGSSEVRGYNYTSMRTGLHAAFPGRTIWGGENPTAEKCKEADVIIVAVGNIDREGADRRFALKKKHLDLVELCLANNPNTIIIPQVGGGIHMADWVDRAAAILYAWYPGQYGGTAIGEVLSGKVNPSAKLPITIEKEYADSPASAVPFPEGFDATRFNFGDGWGGNIKTTYKVDYKEGVFVGYRWYENKKIEPLFPFGFGLSYTTFKYDKLKLSSKTMKGDNELKVSFDITNTGKVAGAEIAQLYIQDVKSSVDRPIKELKGFDKVFFKPGETKTVTLTVTKKDLSFWNKKWIAEPGEFKVIIGASSVDQKLKGSFEYK